MPRYASLSDSQCKFFPVCVGFELVEFFVEISTGAKAASREPNLCKLWCSVCCCLDGKVAQQLRGKWPKCSVCCCLDGKVAQQLRGKWPKCSVCCCLDGKVA